MSVFNRLLVCVALTVFTVGAPMKSWADTEVQSAEESHDHDHEHGAKDHEHDHAGVDHDHSTTEVADHVGDDHAGDEHATPPLLQLDMGSAIVNLAIFLGVLAILTKFVWPVILEGLKARESKIHGDLEAAEKANIDAKNLLSQYEVKLNEASSQVQSMLADARKDSEAAGQRIVDEAKQEAQRQRDRAIADIETAKKVALSDLAGQTSDMAIHVAKQVVGRELNAGDHAELIRQSLERLPSNN